MSNYTPRPWRFDPHDGGQWFGNIVSYGLGKNEVGIQMIRTIDCLRRGAPQAELEATARLIAAAPDLLEALEAVESEYVLTGLLQEIVADAIAKATLPGV